MRAIVAILFCAAGCATQSDASFPSVTDPGGCRLQRVTEAGDDDGHFQFHGPSPDGKRLIVGTYRGDAAGAYLLDLSTGARTALEGMTNAGAFSPDGRHALIASATADGQRDLFELDLETMERRTISASPKAEFLGTYSPDGDWILFNSYRSGNSDIYRVASNGEEPERLTSFDGYDAHADFSPDARSIIFHRNLGGDDYDVIALVLDGLSEKTLVGGPGEQAYPAWSPNGGWIAYAEAMTPDRADIFVVDKYGRNKRRITMAPGYNAYPSWSRDGHFIYFNAERSGKRNVYRVRMTSNGDCRR